MQGNPQPTPISKGKRKLGTILLTIAVVLCSCVGILVYIGNSMSPEEIAALNATATSRAISKEETTAIPPTATPELVGQSNTETDVPQTPPQPTSTSSWEEGRDLEVSRDSVQNAFELLGTNFMEPSQLSNGMPRVLGRLGATTIVELHGPSDRLMKGSVLIVANPAILDNTNERTRMSAALIVLPRQCLRDWKNSDQWISTQLKQAATAFSKGKEYSQNKQFKDGSWIKFENSDGSAIAGTGGFFITLTVGRD